jgi:hypothetical protein
LKALALFVFCSAVSVVFSSTKSADSPGSRDATPISGTAVPKAFELSSIFQPPRSTGTADSLVSLLVKSL